MKDKRLGRGLDILLGNAGETKTGDLLDIDVEQIRPNVDQPRKEFDEDGLKELSQSILEKGVIQPIIVRKVPDGYEVVAGERRWRACKALGLKRVPAIVRNVDERGMLELALVENIQREDLNAIEKARGCRELVERYKITQDEVGDRLGMDRSTVSNLLRLLELPAEIQADVSRETLSQGHARALLSLASKEEQLKLADRIKAEGLSVRRVEGIVQRFLKNRKGRSSSASTANVSDLEERLRRILGTKVSLRVGKRSGRMVIEFYGPQDLDRILKLFGV